MRLERRYTQAGKSPFAGMAFRAVDSEIRNPDGSIVFQRRGIDVPAEWSQVAADILAQKYFRRAGVPVHLIRIAEADVPGFDRPASLAAIVQLVDARAAQLAIPH